MKSCKGCWHLSSGLSVPYCMIHGEWQTKIDPYTEKATQSRVGHIPTSVMRSKSGECGPGRKLYTTFWRLLWAKIKS